jgi:hypothetical protein
METERWRMTRNLPQRGSTRRGRSPSRRITYLFGALLLALAVVSAGANQTRLGRGASVKTDASTSAIATPGKDFFPDVGTLAPGRYVTAAFRPRFTFTVAGGTWGVNELPDYVELTRQIQGARVAVTLFRPSRVFTVEDAGAAGETAPVPRELQAWLGKHRRLDTTRWHPASLGGLQAASADVVSPRPPTPAFATCDQPCTLLFLTGRAEVRVGVDSGEKTRYYVAAPAGGPLVAVASVMPQATFGRGIAVAEQLLRSVRFE